MLKSMTGFGKAVTTHQGSRLEVEIRSLNAKAMDISVKLPPVLKDKEMEIRGLLTEQLGRGKLDVFVNMEGYSSNTLAVNHALAHDALAVLRALETLAGQQSPTDYVSLLCRFPDVIQTTHASPDPDLWPALKGLLLQAISELDRFRAEEGKILASELARRVKLVRELLLQVDIFENQRIPGKKERLQAALAELSSNLPDPWRLEQEMIYYLEKYDFTEEKVRLNKHLDFFGQCMEEEDDQGRKLNFIVQEMIRETNTLGSKAYDADIQKIVVMMKDEIEKIKEQLSNIL